MANATIQSYNRLAVVFDFDDTLAPDSLNTLLESRGIDGATFKQEQVQPLVEDGWDEFLAKAFGLIGESRRQPDVPITAESLHALGRELELFDGVPGMFNRVRECARGIIPDVDVKFYLITSGLLAIARATRIAGEFEKLWGCEFHYGDDGAIEFVKQIVTHTEKTRYLLRISRGLDDAGPAAELVDLFGDAPAGELYIPLSQIVYVGDGASDMPVFSLLNARRGITIGVYKQAHSADQWASNASMSAGRRIENLAPVDFSEDGELMRSLVFAVKSICNRIALSRLGAGE